MSDPTATADQSHAMDNVVGRLEAARIVGVTHQTIKNWADDGIIHWGARPAVLARMNEGKSGRRHERYYFRDEIESMRLKHPTEDLISVHSAAEQLGVTRRTVTRMCEREGYPTYLGPAQVLYMRRVDLDKRLKAQKKAPSTT